MKLLIKRNCRFRKTSLLGGMVACLFLMLTPHALAVQVNDEGYGQVLIFPFYSAAIGNTSLITIANDLAPPFNDEAADPTAVKVRFLGAVDGSELASFNVYLGRSDAWVAAVHKENGNTMLITPDESCIFPEPQDGVLATLAEDIGSIEVLQMGTANDSGLEAAIRDQDCDAIEVRWTQGPWDSDPSADLDPPRGSLRGSLTLIHVEKGTAYALVATALGDFSDIVQHTYFDDPLPNLSTAHDAGTDTALGTTSTVCYEGGCVSDVWPTPIEAVAAALTRQELHGEFVTTDSLAAETEWVISMPTRKYEVLVFPGTFRASLYFTDRDGGGVLFPPCLLPLEPYDCTSMYSPSLADTVNIVSFGQPAASFGQPAISAIVGKHFTVEFPRSSESPVPDEGIGRLGFEPTRFNDSGRAYYGVPVLGYTLQEFTNAFLSGQEGQYQRANYGMAIPMASVITIRE